MPGPIESSVGTSDVDANDDLLKQVDRLCMEMEQLANQANAEKASAAIAAASGGFPDPKDLHSQIDVLLAEAESTKSTTSGEPAASPIVQADPSQDALLDQISNLAAQLAMETTAEPESVVHVAPVEAKPEPVVSAPVVSAPVASASVVAPQPVVLEQSKVEVTVAPASQLQKTMGWFALNTLFLGVCVWGWLIFVRQPMVHKQESAIFDFEHGAIPSVSTPKESPKQATPASHESKAPAKAESHGTEAKKASKPAKKDAHGGGH